MRENRTHGSEGGEGASPSRPLSMSSIVVRKTLLKTPLPIHFAPPVFGAETPREAPCLSNCGEGS